MTFVAILHADVCPLIIADSMISRPNISSTGIETPLLDVRDSRTGGGYTPVGLSRKFWILPNKSLFVYSGVVARAKSMFDFIVSLLSNEHAVYDNEMHTIAKLHRAQNMQGGFSYIVLSHTGADIEVHSDGSVISEQTASHGFVLAIGSGAVSGMEILKRNRGAAPQSPNEMIVKALSAAATLTLDYQDDWGRGSQMSAASCGGYFEVVSPLLFEQHYQSLHRSVAHVFITRGKDVRLSKFVAARQLEDKTDIIVGDNINIRLNDWKERFVGNALVKYSIKNNIYDSVCARPYDGQLTINHIPFVVIYVEGIPYCGRADHAFRTHKIVASSDLSSAVLMLIAGDDSLSGHDDVLVQFVNKEELWDFILTTNVTMECPLCSPPICC